MKLALPVSIVSIWLLTCSSLSAQDADSAKRSTRPARTQLPAFVEDALRAIIATYERPLHPIVKGVAPTGGLGAGVQYEVPFHERWDAEASAVVTVRQYWWADVIGGYRGRRTRVEAYARVRDMSQLDFFGPGTNSALTDRTNFRLLDRAVGVLGSVRVAPWVSIGGRVEELWPDVGRGRSTTIPSIEERFDEASAPGLTAQPRFTRYQGSVDLHIPAGFGEAFYQGAKYRVAYALFDDRALGRYSFRRLEMEAQQRFALGGPQRRLTLHGWVSTTDTDAVQDVPFYLQRTLGEKGNLRSVHEDLIGSDGTQATLRGFRDFRFRDRHLLLLQAEYRMPVWGPVDASIFADAGKVTGRRADLGTADLRRSYGFGLSVMRGPTTVARVDLGLGSGEGARVLLSLGNDIVP